MFLKQFEHIKQQNHEKTQKCHKFHKNLKKHKNKTRKLKTKKRKMMFLLFHNFIQSRFFKLFGPPHARAHYPLLSY